MAAFAISVSLLRSSGARMAFKAGHEEDLLLKELGIKINEMEPKGKGGTEVIYCVRTYLKVLFNLTMLIFHN